MIQDFVKAWETNKDYLRDYFASNEQENYNSYKRLIGLMFSHVINPYLMCNGKQCFDLNRLHEIDDGEYQGTLLYVIPMETYQPSFFEYVITYVGYGSCSGCDALMAISYCKDGLPTDEQVNDYMKLCLHILQHFKYVFDIKECNCQFPVPGNVMAENAI